MSLLRKIDGRRSLNSQSIAAARFLSTASSRGSDRNTFPDKPTSAYYDDLVNEAGRSGDFVTVRHLLNKRIRDGCFNGNDTFKFITNTESSLAVLDELSQTLARLHKGLARKNAYDSLISRLCKLGRIGDAMRVIDSMINGEIGLSACSFHPILNFVTRKKKMDEAWRVINLMREIKISPDLMAYNYLLTAYCVVKNLSAAAEVLTKMREEGMEGDTRTYDAMVLGACKVSKVEGALMVLRRMEEDGIPVLYSTHVHVVNALLKMKCYAQAVEFVLSYSGRDKALDTESFGVLARWLIKAGQSDEAKMVVQEMKRRGLAIGGKLTDFYEWNVKKH